MKKRSRLLAMLMALAMVLAYMPAMAFAEGEEPASNDGTPTVEESVDETEELSEDASQRKEAALEKPELEIINDDKLMAGEEVSFSFEPAADKYYYLYEEEYIDFEDGDIAIVDGDEYTYTYQNDWGNDCPYSFYIESNVDPYYLNDGQAFTYEVFCVDRDTDEILASDGGFTGKTVSDYKHVWSGVLRYELNDYNTSDAGVWGRKWPLSGGVVVANSIALSDGVVRPVTLVNLDCEDLSSVTIPTSVTSISLSYVGAGFTIFGTIGSYAQTYANANNITFRDLAAEAEAARQGTYVAGLPKVKISKPSAAKKSINVKWKKLTKKQLKKGVNKIEVWVCPNSAFGAGDTIIKFAGKKKASLKVKGLKKGTYFVKVRAIQYVGGVKYYTAWSKVKKVKIKK